MAYYKCITAVGKYKEGDIRTVSRKRFNKLPDSEIACFEEYDSNALTKTTIEQIQDNIEEEDKLENQ